MKNIESCYEIRETIGRGKYLFSQTSIGYRSQVVMAIEQSTQKPVAIKIIKKSSDKESTFFM